MSYTWQHAQLKKGEASKSATHAPMTAMLMTTT